MYHIWLILGWHKIHWNPNTFCFWIGDRRRVHKCRSLESIYFCWSQCGNFTSPTHTKDSYFRDVFIQPERVNYIQDIPFDDIVPASILLQPLLEFWGTKIKWTFRYHLWEVLMSIKKILLLTLLVESWSRPNIFLGKSQASQLGNHTARKPDLRLASYSYLTRKCHRLQ